MKTLITIVFLIVIKMGWGCSCAINDRFTEKDLKWYSVIVTGKVLSVDTIARYRRVYKVEVLNYFKTQPDVGDKYIYITTGMGGGDCGYTFFVGQKYVIYGSRSDPSEEISKTEKRITFSTGTCYRNTSNVDEETKVLNRLLNKQDCQCSFDSKTLTEEELKDYEYVFKGTVVMSFSFYIYYDTLTKTYFQSYCDSGGYIVSLFGHRVEVVSYFKDGMKPLRKYIYITGWGGCRYQFSLGKTYIIYSNTNWNDKKLPDINILQSGECARTTDNIENETYLLKQFAKEKFIEP